MKHLRMIGLAFAAAVCAAQANAQELTGTLKNIKETGAITLGHRDSSIPFSYLDDNQKPIGFAMDICYKIVDAVKKELKLDKLEVKLNPVTSSTRIPLLANGTIDLECGSTTNNTERQKQISYTNTHFLTASRYVTKKASKINSIDDLKGKSVVDAATAALYTGGEGQKIYDKWFTQKIPPKGLNLNVPISSELKNEFAKPSDSPDPDSYK